MLPSRYIVFNKKRTLITILNIIVSMVIILTIAFIFSSAHHFFVQLTLKNKPYHAYIESNNIPKAQYIKEIKNQGKSIYITYNDILKTYEYTDQICKKMKCQKISYNENLLFLYGVSKNNKSIYKILIIAFLIIGIGIFIIISNAFRISIIERQKDIYILKEIGMTKIQLFKMILVESSIIFVVSLTVSLIISLWLSQLSITFFNHLFYNLLNFKMIFSVYPLFVLITFMYLLFIFYLSALFPLIRNNYKKNFKYKKIPKKFKVTTALAYINYYRSKKRYRAIKLCIFICSIFYISVSLYYRYGIDLLNKYIDIPSYDYEISTVDSKNNYLVLKDFALIYDKYKLDKECIRKNNKQCVLYELKLYVKDKNEIDLSRLKLKDGFNFVNMKKARKLMNNIILTFKLMFYSALFFLILVSISLIGSTFFINFYLRKKEFIILRNIGLTKKKLKNILLKECIFIIYKPFIVIILFSFLISYILSLCLTDYMNVKMINPTLEIISCFIISALILYISLTISTKKENV